MLRRFIFGILIAVVGFGIYLVWYTLPKSIDREIAGVEYVLGKDGGQTVRPVPIAMRGTLKRSLFGRSQFKGVFDLQGESMPLPDGERTLLMSADRRNGSPMVYYYFDEYHVAHTYSHGIIFADPNFRDFTIMLTHPDGWSAVNGKMISAPATNREEALRISNELMREHLQGLTLK